MYHRADWKYASLFVSREDRRECIGLVRRFGRESAAMTLVSYDGRLSKRGCGLQDHVPSVRWHVNATRYVLLMFVVE